MNEPAILGLKKSFGFGDRLGLAGPGHVAAARLFDFAPIFAQQSIRELARTQRTPEEVLQAARQAVSEEGYDQPWGADADHLKTPEDARRLARAGYTFFTIDPSEHVNNAADGMRGAELETALNQLETEGRFPDPEWKDFYLNQRFELEESKLSFSRETLYRAAVKYGGAIAHTALVGTHIVEESNGRPFEIEVSVDETETPTTTLEHLFYGMELRRRKVPHVVSLAPRFIGDFEKGIDYKGDLASLEASLREHAAVARRCGPYKISVHSGSDKFAAYPVVGRACGDLLHVKTAGTSYLEALRVVARQAPTLFAEIAAFCRNRFETDRASYHISTTARDVDALPPFRGPSDEGVYLDEIPGRQLLHVTFGSVLTAGRDSGGRAFKEGILEQLHANAGLHRELLERHFEKHLSLLNKG